MSDRLTVAATAVTTTITGPGIAMTVDRGAASSDLLALRRRLDVLLGSAAASEANQAACDALGGEG
jgi:hypothetical protein